MSRHRHVRNLRHDDYDDFDDGADSYEEEEDADMAAYMWRGDSVADSATDSLMESLAAQFREMLGDESVERSEIDAAIVAADYDVEAAIVLLRSQIEVAGALEVAAAARLELERPSPIGRMIGEEEEEEDDDEERCRTAGLSGLPPAVPPRVQALVVESGNALTRSDFERPAASVFQFDKPSPDDVVHAKHAHGSARIKSALKLPPPSSRRRSSPAVAVAAAAPAVASVTPKELPSGRVLSKAAAAASATPMQKQPQLKAVKQRAKKVDMTAKKGRSSSSVSVVVAGHVDAGKSTLLGHFLQLVGTKEEQKGKGARRAKQDDLAWYTDEDGVERERGVTIDICTRVFRSEGKNGAEPRTFAMIDAPGHRDFVPAMILGAAQATAALLVVDASIGEFEAGFSEDGQTREHAVLLRSLGVTKLIVVVNKMDTVGYAQARYDEICSGLRSFFKTAGWRRADVSYIPASGRVGVNLVSGPSSSDHPLRAWYSQQTVLQALEALPSTEESVIEEASTRPTRLIVSDAFRSTSLGGVIAVSGRLVSGSVAPKDKLALCPGGEITAIKNVEVGSGNRCPVAVAGADNLPVSVGLTDVSDTLIISPGDVLCDPQAPVPVVTQFRARIVTLASPTPLIQGSRVELHIGGGCEAASFSKLLKLVSSKTATVNGRPRRLIKGDSAIVEITCDRAVCLERAEDVKFLGRFTLRRGGRTVAAGLVTDIINQKCSGASAASVV